MIWKKYKAAIIILAFLVALGLVYFFVIEKLTAEIVNKKNKFQESMAIQEKQRNRLKELPELRNNFEILEDAEKKIYPFLKKDKAVELIQEVEKLAENTGNKVAIEVAAPDASAKASAKNATETIISALPVKEYIQLRIKVTGSFFSLLKLLNKLENSHYYLDIVSLQVSRNQNPEEAKREEVGAKNPFSQSSGTRNADNGGAVENSQKTVSLINVVVYTQN